MIRTAIIEDNPVDARELSQLLQRYTSENGDVFQVTLYESADSFLAQYQPYDLIFMDIELPGQNGMDAARRLRQKDTLATLIFITNMAQYALHGYEVDALDFILKPVQYATLSMKLKKALRNIRTHSDIQLSLMTTSGFVRISASEMLYVEVRKHYLTYYTETDAYTARGAMKSAEQELNPLHFVRCNNCYLVNLRHVRAVQGNDIVVGTVSLQMSRSRRADFLRQLADYLGGSLL